MAHRRPKSVQVAPKGNRTTQITKQTDTVRAVNSKFSESFVPGWDSKAGSEQAMARTEARAKMGSKMTPINRPVPDNQR